ncbi:hypothetical protein [Enterovirga rhinocerotis]|uniref:Uncharacterized protein n=1 Tax=Enterovirga rhinocerotis TaxID=1339210 RepID=A0A4R7BXI1_9HYPH|nr:hypothetical protein [Enterovirga rhinocerotis]TDR90291.1 hypothetical protein EV668_3137 [Enterovirga rhinocerotis]
MKMSAIKIDSAKAEAGVRVRLADFDPRFEDAWVKVRAFGNKDDQRIIDKQNRLRRGTITNDAAAANMTERLREAILVDWGGFTDDNDKAVPYSREQADTWLADKDYALFRAGVVWAASEVSNGDAKDIEADSRD